MPILSHGERIPPDLGKRKRAYDLEADLEGKEEANLPDGNCSTDSWDTVNRQVDIFPELIGIRYGISRELN